MREEVVLGVLLMCSRAQLIRCFDFQLADPAKPWDSLSYTVFLEENMWVKVTEAAPLE